MTRLLLVLLFAVALSAVPASTSHADDAETLPGSIYEPPPGMGWWDDVCAAWKRVFDDNSYLRPAVVRA